MHPFCNRAATVIGKIATALSFISKLLHTRGSPARTVADFEPELAGTVHRVL
jgi:hypothetical protein